MSRAEGSSVACPEVKVSPRDEISESCLRIDDSLETEGERSPTVTKQVVGVPELARTKINIKTGGKFMAKRRDFYLIRKNIAEKQKHYVKFNIFSGLSVLVKILFVSEFLGFHLWPFRIKRLLEIGFGLSYCKSSNKVFHRWKQKIYANVVVS